METILEDEYNQKFSCGNIYTTDFIWLSNTVCIDVIKRKHINKQQFVVVQIVFQFFQSFWQNQEKQTVIFSKFS